MPPQWHFPRWRHASMQGIMWLLLGGTIALAGLLDGHLRRASIITLGDAIVDGPLSFKVPDNWNVESEANPAFNLVRFTATKPDDPDDQLVLKVVHQKITSAIFPSEYLRRLIGADKQVLRSQSRRIDGYPALVVKWAGIGSSDDQSLAPEGIACCVIVPWPNHVADAITIDLERIGPLDQSDGQLLDKVLDAIKISPPN